MEGDGRFISLFSDTFGTVREFVKVNFRVGRMGLNHHYARMTLLGSGVNRIVKTKIIHNRRCCNIIIGRINLVLRSNTYRQWVVEGYCVLISLLY